MLILRLRHIRQALRHFAASITPLLLIFTPLRFLMSLLEQTSMLDDVFMMLPR